MDAHCTLHHSRADIFAAPKFQSAFALLLDSTIYAEHTGGDRWDYAVNVRQLLRVGLSENDLRFLVRLKLVEYAYETTSAGSMQRQFRSPPEAPLTPRTSFVLTRIGQEAIPRYLGSRTAATVERSGTLRVARLTAPVPRNSLPRWDRHRRTLWFDGQVVKQFRWPALNQEQVLATFHEEGWPVKILDPLTPDPTHVVKQRLRETIKSLNRGQTNALVHFRGDGTGEGIVWEAAV